MMADNNFLLDIRDFSVSFKSGEGYHTVVKNISFTIPKNSILGVVGESGSGKSVTALSTLRLLPEAISRFDSGKMIFCRRNGEIQDLLTLPGHEMLNIRGKEISMIFQEPMTSLNPVLTCGYQVAEAIRTHFSISGKDAMDETLQLFKEVKLPRPEEMLNNYPHQLSGGQKQRVMIAIAISCKPSLLIADEPTTALDVSVQKGIFQLLHELQEKNGISILLISHDLAVIAEVANEAVVMYKGEIMEKGSVKQLFKNPSHPYTRGLIACRPVAHSRARKLPTVEEYMHQTGSSYKGESGTENKVINVEFVPESERNSRLLDLYKNKPLLELKNLRTWYPGKKKFLSSYREYIKAVDDVSLEVYPGETFGLVGESGCGKSTLGKSIIKLEKPTSGEIIYKGENLHNIGGREFRKVKQDIQIIFQDPYSSLNPRIPVGVAIIEPLRAHHILGSDKERRFRVMELLERVQLKPEHYYRYPHEFSGGQRQRICIARSLIMNPKFVICDEAVSALDVSVQASVLNLLNELKKEFGLTYIFISHDLTVVKYMSDRIAVMKEGRLVELGDADQVYRNPVSEYTRKLIEAIPGGG